MQPEPCPTCGAAMAADQRYCLACGQRRAEARLDFLEILRAAPAGTTPSVAAAPRARTQGASTIVASVGTLLLAMGVGVLIGTAGEDPVATTPVAQPTQVIRVQGGGAAPAAATEKAPAEKTKRTARKDDVPEAASAAESKATNPELQKLESASPEDYQKQSQKLPKTLSTGGAAPPKDDKAPAAGGAFEEIG